MIHKSLLKSSYDDDSLNLYRWFSILHISQNREIFNIDSNFFLHILNFNHIKLSFKLEKHESKLQIYRFWKPSQSSQNKNLLNRSGFYYILTKKLSTSLISLSLSLSGFNSGYRHLHLRPPSPSPVIFFGFIYTDPIFA